MLYPQHGKWRKSSRSVGSGNCVEVADQLGGDGVLVRDSKDPDGPRLVVGGDGWASFVAGVKGGAIA